MALVTPNYQTAHAGRHGDVLHLDGTYVIEWKNPPEHLAARMYVGLRGCKPAQALEWAIDLVSRKHPQA